MKWSYSAHRTLRRCQRQFAFAQIVASSTSHEQLRHEAFLLKQLQSLSIWQGDLVHEIVADALPDILRGKSSIDSASLIDKANLLAGGQFEFSAERKYRTPGLTKTGSEKIYCALTEHEVDKQMPQDALSNVAATLAHCLKNFVQNTDLIRSIRNGHDHKIEKWSGFSLDDVWVSVKLDLAYLRPEGQPTIVDWKVANSETSDYAGQLGIYALAITKMDWWKNIQPDAIELYEVNLLRGEVIRHCMNIERLEAAEDLIYRSCIDIKTLFGSHSFADLDLDELEVANRPGTCATCNYSKLCIESFARSGRVKDAELIQERLL